MPKTNQIPRDERVLLTVADLETIKLSDTGWPMICLQEIFPELKVAYKKPDMLPYVGPHIWVREELVYMLRKALQLLQNQKPGYGLWVCYGYRHPEVQEKYFFARYAEQKKKYPELRERELIERTHMQVAYPAVAGHPTGGAVDVTIVDTKGCELDMGTGIADYTDEQKCLTFAEGLTKEQMQNRLLLREVMLQVGFAPFNGEWWHFSFGDREWAYYFGRQYSLYDSLDFRDDGYKGA